MRNGHFYLSPIKAALALETDHAVSLSRLLDEMAVTVDLAIVPCLGEGACHIRAETVKAGDLQDLPEGLDLLISNSHGIQRARAIRAAHYQTGFPADKVIGYSNRISIGYRGVVQTINDMANAVMKPKLSGYKKIARKRLPLKPYECDKTI